MLQLSGGPSLKARAGSARMALRIAGSAVCGEVRALWGAESRPQAAAPSVMLKACLRQDPPPGLAIWWGWVLNFEVLRTWPR